MMDIPKTLVYWAGVVVTGLLGLVSIVALAFAIWYDTMPVWQLPFLFFHGLFAFGVSVYLFVRYGNVRMEGLG